MKRLTLVALVFVTGAGSWAITKAMARGERQRLERWGGDAEMRAVLAEKRADGYKRAVVGDENGTTRPAEAPTLSGAAGALAAAPFPFDAQIADLTKQLALDANQTGKLRQVYERYWQAAKQLAALGTAPAAGATGPLSVDAAAFLSPEQLRRLQQIEDHHEEVEVPRMAEDHAKAMAQALGLSAEQTRRAADALAAMYRAPGPAAAADKLPPVDHLKQTLRPILNDEQWATLVASLADHDFDRRRRRRRGNDHGRPGASPH